MRVLSAGHACDHSGDHGNGGSSIVGRNVFITVEGFDGFGQDAGFIDDGNVKTKTLTMQA